MRCTSEPLTDDAFLGGALHVLQPARGYRAGLDAVLLAAATPVRDAARVRILDVGAGAGVVGLAIARRVPDAHVTLVELQPSLAALARRNVERNGLAARVEVIEADVLAGGAALNVPDRPAGLAPGLFAHVVSNPPHHVAGLGTPSPRPIKAAAHQMAADALDRWVAFMITAAATGGTLTLIHRADALAALLAALDGRAGAIRVVPVHARAGEAAVRILITAVKGSRAPLAIGPGLVLHEADGSYRPEIEAVLRHGQPLAV